MGSILVTNGPARGDYFPLRLSETIIGRHEHCSIQILDDAVSGRHLQISMDEADDSYRAADLGSTNGVIINGVPLLVETPLRDGDIIVIGNSRIVFSIQEFPDRERAAAQLKRPGEDDKTTIVSK